MKLPRFRSEVAARAVHTARVAMVIALLLAIPPPRGGIVDSFAPPPIETVRKWVSRPSVRIGDRDANGMWRLTDGSGASIGMVARTLPMAREVVGYRGPSEAIILLDDDLQIVSVGLLSSDDTKEHVAAVESSETFFDQFKGWKWGGLGSGVQIDGVSGATLTSLALAQGVIKRIGGRRLSLLFPTGITQSERDTWTSDANDTGRLIRSGPYSDALIGYQGPTELLMKVGPNDQVEKMAIRSSFDNEPYVDYVRTERGFWKRFTGRSLADLAKMDLAAEGIEGVSGATMTSMAIAETIVHAAGGIERERKESKDKRLTSSVRWATADLATIAMTIVLAIISHSKAFRLAGLRKGWLVAVILVIGIWAGNLMSMALVAGWSAHAIAWRLAPGLASIAALAFIVPAISKANPYCNHLCPHGAIQQLIKPSPKSRHRIRLTRRIAAGSPKVPGAILVTSYLAILFYPSLDLASWEPFHAYLFRIASWTSIAFAIATLAVSALVPMAYCRIGCPTGRLIDYVRFNAAGGKIRIADVTVIALLAIAMLAKLYR